MVTKLLDRRIRLDILEPVHSLQIPHHHLAVALVVPCSDVLHDVEHGLVASSSVRSMCRVCLLLEFGLHVLEGLNDNP